MCCVDPEKGLNNIPTKVLKWAMKKKGIPEVSVGSAMSLFG